MLDETKQPETANRNADNWARRVDALQVAAAPDNARNINVAGRQVAGPIQGFGQMWQKTYRVRLEGVDIPAPAVLMDWQEHFAEFQPSSNRFHLPASGLSPGEVALIDSQLASVPMVSTGVMVLYRDSESFTFITPEGHPEAGWITFSVDTDEGAVIAQIQSLARAADPLYEFGFRIFGSRMQEGIWRHVLTQLACYYDLEAQVSVDRQRVDNKMQWRKASNIRHNAQIRTTLHAATSPLRAIQSRLRS